MSELTAAARAGAEIQTRTMYAHRAHARTLAARRSWRGAHRPLSHSSPCAPSCCRQADRVAALKCLFERKAGSPRRFRHDTFKHIAEKAPEAWRSCGTQEQRDKAIVSPKKGERVHPIILTTWDRAFKEAFGGEEEGGFEFHHQPAPSGNIPQGHSTTELSFLQ